MDLDPETIYLRLNRNPRFWYISLCPDRPECFYISELIFAISASRFKRSERMAERDCGLFYFLEINYIPVIYDVDSKLLGLI
ncbi:hypothetical protein ES703_56587 [subsurface metagenome]